MSASDAHYGGNLVDGARMLALFGDVATELLIRADGDEGLFAGYASVEFLAPVYAGDYIEAEGRIVRFGNTSREMTFEARKVVAPRPDLSDSAADALAEPVVVTRARGTCVVSRDKQRLCQIPAHESADREAIRDLVGRVNAAWTGERERIVERLSGLLSDDMVIRGPGFVEQSRGRAACIDSYAGFASAAELHAFESEEPAIDLLDGGAIATYRWTIEYTLGGERKRESGYDALALRRDGDRWQVSWRTMLPDGEDRAAR